MCLSPSYHQAAEIIPPVIPPFSVTSRLPTWFEMNKYQLAALRFVFTASVSSLFKQLENWSAHWPGVCVVCFYEYFSRVSLGLNLNWVVSFFTPWRTFIMFFWVFLSSYTVILWSHAWMTLVVCVMWHTRLLRVR